MNNPKAYYDRCYCTNDKCKKDCWRKVDNWEFEDDGFYSFIASCNECVED